MTRAALSLLAAVMLASAWAAPEDDGREVPLQVPQGAPLRLYLTRKLSKRAGAPVEAKLLEPVFAFDKEVIPAGTVARGTVGRVQPVSHWQRTRAILGGDLTPLHEAEVTFTSLVLPGGREVAVRTAETEGLNSIYVPPSGKPKKPKKTAPPKPQDQNGGLIGTAKQTAKDRLTGAVNSRTQGVFDVVRGPNKREKLIDFMWSKLPYHPQYLRKGTRFDAPIEDALAFGSETVKPADLAELGAQPAPGSVAQVRLLTALDSASAKPGDRVEAVLAAPLFTGDHKLVLPEGSRLVGAVVVARKARTFHRAGRLRFNFQNIEMPPAVAALKPAGPAARPAVSAQATLSAAEAGGTAPIKVDSEGGVQAQESKSRFLAPAISLMLANRAADNDAGRNHASGGGTGANVSGRTLGGGLGFGMAGSAVAQSSRWVGMAFGYYGLAWSVYSNLVARGGEVQFGRNAMMEIKFETRVPEAGAKFVSGGAQ
ncbi:MAG: hypothetical protein KGN36_11335 [Acidobacteriota bacterium]|nr:hypothetical protein [Acidobacteriota bacterium]